MEQQMYKINSNRLLSSIQTSAKYGTLPNGGLGRVALSKEDQQIRDLLKSWMEDCNLDVRVDDFGNMYGRREGKDPHASPVVIGSHLDTQPIGGKYDGVLGVMAALEVIRTLNDEGVATNRPIEMVNFTNEEGARFEPALLGSGGIARVFSAESIMNTKDKDGKTFGEELENIGYNGSAQNRLSDPYCYVELHIEQGPVLEDSGASIGVVTGIQGISSLEVTIHGRTSHAGTTPMKNRRDAMLLAAKMIQQTYKTAEHAPDLLVTVGRIQASPNVTNSLAEQVVFSIDVRHPEDTVREQYTNEIKEKISTLALVEKMDMHIKDIVEMKAEIFAKDIVEGVEAAARKHGYSSKRVISGAGHDAMYMNKLAPTGMIFIPSIGGVSHCEEEFSEEADIEKGAQTLLELTLTLANRDKELQR